MPPAPNDLLALAVRAAEAGGREALARCARPGPAEVKASRADLVSSADRAVEALVVAELLAARPDDGIVSEEGLRRPSRSGVRWVLDPIDGTTNYLYRLPHWAVSLAGQTRCGDGWRTVAAAVCDPLRQETFSAAAGSGAHLNGAVLTGPSPADDLAAVLLAMALPVAIAERSVQIRALATWLADLRDVRTTGSSALDLCWVAAGRFDAFYEPGIALWDAAAGALIVEEAGGRVAARGDALLASGAGVHARLLDLITRPVRRRRAA